MNKEALSLQSGGVFFVLDKPGMGVLSFRCWLTLLLTDLVEHHSAEGERSFNADRLGSLASWCAKLPFLFKEDAEYEV